MNSFITQKIQTKLLSSFHLRIFPYTLQASLHSQVSHCRFPENCVSKLNTEEKRVTLWVAFTHRKAVSQKASFWYWSEDISFFTVSLNQLIKCHFAEHKIREVANCSKKGRVELCVMKSHIRKQSNSKLLSSYYLRMFPFSPWSLMGSQISLCSFHKNSVSKLLPANKAVPLREEFTDHKEDSQNASFRFWTDDISFISVGLNSIQRSPSQVPQKLW